MNSHPRRTRRTAAGDLRPRGAAAGAAALALALFLFPAASPAHAFDGPEGVDVSGSNQTQYSVARQADTEHLEDTEFLEEWFDLDLGYGDLRGGLRYEAFQPPQRTDPLGETLREGIPFRYLELTRSWGRVRAGNFYTLFGRGLSLNLFEDRDVRIDNNLDGIQFASERGPLAMTFLSGRARRTTTQRWNTEEVRPERLDLIHAADVTYRPVGALQLGASYVRQRTSAAVDQDQVRDLWSGRVEGWWGPLSLYGESGHLDPQPGGGDTTGVGRYVGVTFSVPGIGITAEMKDYDHFAFNTQDGRIYLNNPPSLSREHAQTLLNRHPHQLSTNDEKGYQVEVNLAPTSATQLVLNSARARTHGEGPTPATAEVRTTYQEFYAEVRHTVPEATFPHLVGIGATTEDRSTENTALVAEATWALSDLNSLHGEFEHLHTKLKAGGAYDNEMLLVEFSRAPRWSLGFSTEWTNASEAQRGTDDTAWAQGSLTYLLGEDTDASVTYGSRQAGYSCMGGRCRYVPAFDGLELKLTTRF